MSDTVKQAVWRGSSVMVLKADDRTAVIRTPCQYSLRVRLMELHALGRKKKPKVHQ